MDKKIARAHFVKWEGEIPYMYLDSKNNVTVGIGHLLKTVEAAQALNFVYRQDQPEQTAGEKGVPKAAAKKGDAARPEAIAADYDRVEAKAGLGYRAQAFAKIAELELSSDDLGSLFEKDVAVREGSLSRIFPDYNTYPPSAQLALLDLVFNVGADGLRKKFVSLGKAVRARDWNTAAKNCHRKSISEERNKDTENLFQTAVVEERVMGTMKKIWDDALKVRPRIWFPFAISPGLMILPALAAIVRQRSEPPPR